MISPNKTIPMNYRSAGSVSLKKTADITAMLVWSVVLFLLPIPLIYLVLRGRGFITASFSIRSVGELLTLLGGIVLVTIVMLVLHEGLHGLVFWLVTHERPKFAFKWYYASACAEGWYLPRNPYLIATLLPLIVITAAGLIILPILAPQLRYLLILLIVFNASGCAGDVVVAVRLLRLPKGTLSLDQGDEVNFFVPSGNG